MIKKLIKFDQSQLLRDFDKNKRLLTLEQKNAAIQITLHNH